MCKVIRKVIPRIIVSCIFVWLYIGCSATKKSLTDSMQSVLEESVKNIGNIFNNTIKKSDDEKRAELQKFAKINADSGYPIKKLEIQSICDRSKPDLFRYICWRYYEVGGDIWKYRIDGSIYYILITNGVPIATQKSAKSFLYYEDKDKKELGYRIIKGRMAP